MTSARSRAVPRNIKPATPSVVVKPVHNAMRILRYLSQSGRPHTLTRIARDLAINPSTCFNILRTLAASHVIEFDAETKSYVTAAGVLDLAEGYLSQGGLLREAQLKMQGVAYEFAATTTLWRRAGADRLVLVALIDSIADLRVHMRLGQRMPLLVGAMGRVMAVHGGLEEAERRRRFAAIRWQTPLRFRSYQQQAEEGARRGWAIDRSNHVKGVVTVATPIFDASRGVPMVLAASMYDGSGQKALIGRIAASIVATAAEISRHIAGSR